MSSAWNRRDVIRAGLIAAAPAAARGADFGLSLDRDVRVALLGLEGHFGEAVRVAERHPRVKIIAVETTTDRERERGGNIAALAEARRYEDYRELLDREKLDAVCVCDRNDRRAESVIACLDHGIPTAAEKPMALSLDDLERVRRVSESTRTPLTMLLPMRFDPPYATMRTIVAAGRIGEAVNLSGQKSYQLGERPEWMKDRASFGGTIPYIGVHLVDLLRFISGRDMVKTAAFHGRVGFPEIRAMENTAAVGYRLDNGGTADLRLDYLRPKAGDSHGDDRLRIAGTQGVIEYQRGRVTLMTDDEPPREVSDFEPTRPLFADFLDGVFNGKPRGLTEAEAFRVTEIVLRSREAADSGRVVRI